MPKNDTVNMPASGSQSPNGIDGDIDYTIYDEKGFELNNQPESLGNLLSKLGLLIGISIMIILA